MARGTPLIPPFKGAFCMGVAVVTFTDIVGCVGGSSGSVPCKDTMGSRVAASASSSGPGSTIARSSLICSVVSGPQVTWGCSDPDSDITGVSAQCLVRLVVCTWIV